MFLFILYEIQANIAYVLIAHHPLLTAVIGKLNILTGHSFSVHVITATVRVCEGDMFSISCGEEFIDVKRALYGREDGVLVCRVNLVRPCGNADSSLQKVRQACQGKRVCSFTVSNDYFGGDPCDAVGKYLLVGFVCSTRGEY